MGKAHEPNVQSYKVHAKREIGELTPDSGATPQRQEDIEKRTNLSPGTIGSNVAPRVFPKGPDVDPDVKERPSDDKNSIAEPRHLRPTHDADKPEHNPRVPDRNPPERRQDQSPDHKSKRK